MIEELNMLLSSSSMTTSRCSSLYWNHVRLLIIISFSSQREIANRVKNELQTFIDEGKVLAFSGKRVVTTINPAAEFYPAHEDHQAYLDKYPGGYCNHYYR